MRRRAVLSTTLVTLLFVGSANAHVAYVTDDAGGVTDAVRFTMTVLGEPLNVALLGAGGVGVAIVMGAYLAVGRSIPDVAILRRTLAGYGDLVPWMLRLSIGLPLVGAGYAEYLFSPAVETPARLVQLGIGFLLLFGLATRAAAAVGLGVYLLALSVNPDLLLAFEYVGGFLGIILLGGGRPSADAMLQRVAEAEESLYGRIDPVHRIGAWFRRRIDPFSPLAPVVVRVGLGATFVYLGLVEKLFHPNRALAVVAKYDLSALVPVDPGLWVLGAALVEIALGIALVVGVFTRASAAVAFLVLTMTLFGLPDDPVLAHVTLFGLSSAVFTMGAGRYSLDRLLARRLSQRGWSAR